MPGCGETATPPVAAALTEALSVAEVAGVAPPQAQTPTAIESEPSASPAERSARTLCPPQSVVERAWRARHRADPSGTNGCEVPITRPFASSACSLKLR